MDTGVITEIPRSSGYEIRYIRDIITAPSKGVIVQAFDVDGGKFTYTDFSMTTTDAKTTVNVDLGEILIVGSIKSWHSLDDGVTYDSHRILISQDKELWYEIYYGSHDESSTGFGVTLSPEACGVSIRGQNVASDIVEY